MTFGRTTPHRPRADLYRARYSKIIPRPFYSRTFSVTRFDSLHFKDDLTRRVTYIFEFSFGSAPVRRTPYMIHCTALLRAAARRYLFIYRREKINIYNGQYRGAGVGNVRGNGRRFAYGKYVRGFSCSVPCYIF